MPSLRQKVTTYFRQLSFIAEARDGPRSPRKSEADDDGNFITKYLEGRMQRIFVPGPEIYNGQNPTDLPDLKIEHYATGPQSITAACTGPDEGLTGIKRSKLHLSASYADDIDFIDTTQETDCYEVRHSINTNTSKMGPQSSRVGHSKYGRGNTQRKLSSSNLNSISDQNANKTISGTGTGSGTGLGGGGLRSRKNSRTSLTNLNASNPKTTTTKNTNTKEKVEENSNKSTTIVVSMVSTKLRTSTVDNASDQNNQNILNATKTDVDATNNKTTTTVARTNAGNGAITGNTELPALSAQSHGHNKESASTKLLENTTERLLREAVSSQASVMEDFKGEIIIAPDVNAVASVSNWKMESEYAYGISVSLYENNMVTKEPMGNPIADCYGIVVHSDSAALALADGVNWGDGARLAARSAVHGCLDYLDRAIFGMAHECMATTTHEVFVSLLRSLWEGHGCILEVGGALSTLTIAVVLPLSNVMNDEYRSKEVEIEMNGKYVVCACNVGDSLGYVYSKKYGVRELTQASHDITSMRDMRDALGALGPADGTKPELSNLTFSMTIIDKGDIVFLTSDGVSDNFDPVVGKFAEAWTPDVKLMPSSNHGHNRGGILAPKRQNKSASALYTRLHTHTRPLESSQQNQLANSGATPTPPVRPPRTKKSESPENVPPNSSGGFGSGVGVSNAPSRPKYMRSHTVIEPRRLSSAGNPGHNSIRRPAPAAHIISKIPKSISGLPLVTGPQRHALTLYRLEDLLSYGINGTFSPCVSARRLCHLLIDFVRMITSARRKTLEQRELFYKLATGPDGVKREVELNRMQHRAARKRVVDSSAFVALPGKLDHATVVAYTVGAGTGSGTGMENPISTQTVLNSTALQSKEFQETNF